MNKLIHPVLKEIASLFNEDGKQAFLVGGAVRDMIRGKKIHDWDIATDALPQDVTNIIKSMGGKVIPTGIKHGTITIFYKKQTAEITTFRTEADYTDGRRPDKIEFASTIEEDLSRRDFTMNAIALRLLDGVLIDPFGGVKDIKTGIIRCVGNAHERFSEDGLRPLRAIRFTSQLGFEIEEPTFDAISGALPVCAKVSQERLRDEIDKILLSNDGVSSAFRLMEKTGLLALFLNELADCRGIEQKGFHQFDVLDHSLAALDYAVKHNYSHELRLAILLHDIGKPSVRNLDESGIWTFYRHESVSCDMAKKLLTRLRYPNVLIENVCHLIKEHMFLYMDEWSDAAVRRFIARVGENNLSDLYCLRRADVYGFYATEIEPQFLMSLIKRTEEILAQGRSFKIKDLAVSGSDLMQIGIKSGPAMGIILKELLETVLDDPAQNTREKLLEIAERFHKRTLNETYIK